MSSSFADSIFRCPVCGYPLSFKRDMAQVECPECHAEIPIIEGIALLVKDRNKLQNEIEAAKQDGRASWYEEPQTNQWTGPYRHHLKKRRSYLDKTLSRLLETAPAPSLGLDLACGDGGHLEWLSKYVDVLYGSDYNIVRLRRASRVHAPERLFLADIRNYPVADDLFDLVFFNHALEHVKEDRKALEEAFRILKPGGCLILGTPNEGALFWQFAYRIQPHIRAQTDHVHFYTARSLAKKCVSAGFKVLEVRHIGWGVPHWTLDERIRSHKWVDDCFTAIGRTFVPSQSTSLYLIATK